MKWHCKIGDERQKARPRKMERRRSGVPPLYRLTSFFMHTVDKRLQKILNEFTDVFKA